MLWKTKKKHLSSLLAMNVLAGIKSVAFYNWKASVVAGVEKYSLIVVVARK